MTQTPPATALPEAPRGHRVMGGLSGVALGFGLAILLQQFSVTSLSVYLLLLPAALGVAGIVLARPRLAATAPDRDDVG